MVAMAAETFRTKDISGGLATGSFGDFVWALLGRNKQQELRTTFSRAQCQISL
jgi:hypothetical protein